MSRIAWVTGATGGLGGAVTRQLTLVSRRLERLQDPPAGALCIAADCSMPEGAADAVGTCRDLRCASGGSIGESRAAGSASGKP